MQAKIHLPLTVTLLCCLMNCMSVVTPSQTIIRVSSDPWDEVESTPSRTELEVQLVDGTQLKGRLLTATAGMLRLSCTNEIAEVQRDHVLKVYQLSPKPEELRRMLRNAGTISGFGAGFEIAKNKRAGFFLIPALGGTLGAFGGYAFGNRMKTRILIYDAKPRQVAQNPNPKPDNPQALTRPRTIDQSLLVTGKRN